MKDIKGYEGLYAVTSCGKVWSYKRKCFLKPWSNGNGYLLVCLCKDGKVEKIRVHRLVANAYIPNYNNLPEVNHKDEVRYHNWLNNLEWTTHKDNCNYGTCREKIAEAIKKPVYCVELDRVFDSVKEAAKELRVYATNICVCCRNNHRRTNGYHFKYVEEIYNEL